MPPTPVNDTNRSPTPVTPLEGTRPAAVTETLVVVGTPVFVRRGDGSAAESDLHRFPASPLRRHVETAILRGLPSRVPGRYVARVGNKTVLWEPSGDES